MQKYCPPNKVFKSSVCKKQQIESSVKKNFFHVILCEAGLLWWLRW